MADDEPVLTKRCSKCRRTSLPLSAFGVCRRHKDGLKSWCKDCHNAAGREYVKRTYDKRKAYWQEYAKTHSKDAQVLRSAKHHAEHREERNAAARTNYWEMRARRPEALIVMRLRGRAKRSGIPFDITADDIVIPEKCPVLGMPLEMNKTGKGGCNASPSVDRIVPKLGYIRGNIRVISNRANTLKCDATVEELEAVIADLRRLRDSGLGFSR